MSNYIKFNYTSERDCTLYAIDNKITRLTEFNVSILDLFLNNNSFLIISVDPDKNSLCFEYPELNRIKIEKTNYYVNYLSTYTSKDLLEICTTEEYWRGLLFVCKNASSNDIILLVQHLHYFGMWNKLKLILGIEMMFCDPDGVEINFYNYLPQILSLNKIAHSNGVEVLIDK